MNIPVFEVVHSEDGMYDLYNNGVHVMSRIYVENILEYLSDKDELFEFKFVDESF